MGRQKKRKGDPVHGWLTFNKHPELTSTQAVAIVKRLLNAQKAGHGGTLDPLADGILPIALGEATKTSAYAMDADKDYTFEIVWGASTNTQDKEGEIIGESDVRPAPADVATALQTFVGRIEQTPPQFSAIKVNGVRAYDAARDGETVELKSREVDLFEARVDDKSTENTAIIHVTCGKGFYIRSLVRDLAAALGAEGHVALLRRTRVGAFSIENSVSVADLEGFDDVEARRSHLVPISKAMDDVPKVEIPEAELVKLKNGNDVLLFPHQIDAFKKERSELLGEDSDERFALASCNGVVLAMGDVRAGHFQPMRVFQL